MPYDPNSNLEPAQIFPTLSPVPALVTGVNGERLAAPSEAAAERRREELKREEESKPTVLPFSPPTAGGTKGLRYPSSQAFNQDTDYVTFSFFEYDPPFGKNRGQNATGAGVGFGAGGSRSLDFYNASGVAGKSAGAPAKGLETILMFMPEDIQTQFSAKWGGVGFGTGAVGGLRLAGGDGDIQVGAESITGMVKNKLMDVITSGVNAAAGSNVTTNQALAAVTGTILNPNVEVLFEAPDLRGFDLTFKMSPHDGAEAKNIKRICNTFRKAMLPSYGGGDSGNSPTRIGVPNLCQVAFMSGGGVNTFLPQYKLCAITDVSINYTPDGAYATYGDGSPVATVLKITFKETKLIFANEIELDGGGY